MIVFVAVVQSLCCVQLFATPWTAARQAPLSFTVSGSLPRFMSVELVDINLICLTISSSDAPFSFYLQSFPAPGSFPMSWFFESGGQSIGASTSTSVLPMNIQGWFPLGLTGLIFWMSKGLSRVFFMGSQRVGHDLTTKQFRSISSSALSFMVQHSHLYMTTGKTIALTIWTFEGKAMSLLFNRDMY